MRFPLLAVERAHGIGAEVAVDVEVAFGLEGLHRVAHGVVIKGVALVAGDVEALAQRHYALILHAGAKDFAFADADQVGLCFVGRLGRHRALPQFGELGLERLELLLRRIVAVERGAHVAGIGELGQHLGRLRRDQLEFDVGADAAVMDAADLRLARISEDGRGELEFVLGQGVGGRRQLEIRRRIIARIETVGFDLSEIGDRGLGARVGGAIAHPKRLVVARLVERLDAFAVGLAADDALELARDRLAQPIGDGAVGRGGDGGGGRNGDGFGRLGCRRGGVLLGFSGLRLDRLGVSRFGLGRLGLGRLCLSRARSARNVLRRQRRQQVGIRHRDSRVDPLVGLLGHAGMASEHQDQPEGGRDQQAVKSGAFHQSLSKG